MNKLEALTAYLINANLVDAKQIESVVDSVTLYPAGRVTASDQVVLAEKHVSCTFFITHYPLANLHENELFARLVAWLLEFDGDHLGQRDIDISVSVLDVYRCNLEFEVKFVENLVVIEQASGDVVFKQKRYALLP
jgi:hypothetical protein